MKRISDYFTRPTCKRRLTEYVSSNSSDSTIELSVGFPYATSEAENSNSISAVNQNFWPSCSTVEQKNEFGEKMIGYFFKVKKNVGMRISKEWINCEIASYGDNRKQQLTYLRKKILTIKKVPVIKQQLK
jgi:hypothetical protein